MQRHQMQDDEDQAVVAVQATGERFATSVEAVEDGELLHRPRRQDLLPEFSAKVLLWPWQKHALWTVLLITAGTLLITPVATGTVLFAAMAVPFLCVVLLRIAAIERLAASGRVSAPASASTQKREDDLPTYTVLVPLYREAQTVPGLIAALSRLDYPIHLLDIVLIAEEVDGETRSALEHADHPDHMRVMVVPDGAPRTKPRALIYALARTRGEHVVVFDAEDAPEPDQLRRAVAAFRVADERGGPPLACLQARLNTYNPNASWLSRQFTLEYTALFDAILPALQHHDFPVPLGGTSNHFRRDLLERAGAWDPWNVTEDADLGIRLARLGWRVEVLPSTTWEEAPTGFDTWRGQRTRWLKGWMQTFIVHMREPARLWRDLGTRRFIGFQLLMGGLILSALVHPWFYVALAVYFATGTGDAMPVQAASYGAGWLYWLGAFNLLAGYVSAMALGAYAVTKRGWPGLAWHAALMPVYWLLISFAAYRALWQLGAAPHIWEKTEHSPRPAP